MTHDHVTDAWVTIADAAVLVKRAPSTVYRWIDQDRLTFAVDEHNRMYVRASEVLELEAVMRRRRYNRKPRKSPGTVQNPVI